MKKDTWKDLLQKFPTQPKGWLTLHQFMERAGLKNIQGIYDDVRKGRVPSQFIAMCPYKNRMTVCVDWDSVAYDFMIQKRAAFRPDDFVENEARQYKPIRIKGDDPASQINRLKRAAHIEKRDTTEEIEALKEAVQAIPDNQTTLFSSGSIVSPVVDLHSAKYRKEQLDIERKKIEVLILRNEMIEVKEIENEWRGLGITLRGEFEKAATQLAPELATIKDPREIKRRLSAAFIGICEQLWKDENDRNSNN